MKKYKYSRINSIKLMLKDIFDTKIIEGNKLLYSIERINYYFCVIAKKEKLERKIKKHLKKHLNKKMIIKNKIGIFLGDLFDDSFTKYSYHFEYYIQHWFDYDKRKEYFLDIGANRGRYSIQAINRGKYKKVYAFEPLNYNLKYFQKNIELNNLNDKIIVFPYALSDKEKEVKIFFDPIHTGGATIDNPQFKIKEEFVKTKKLDNFIDKINPKKVSFIKIDVEGHEYKLLKGADEFLNKVKKDTYLMIEIWKDNKDKEKTINFLIEKGFNLVE